MVQVFLLCHRYLTKLVGKIYISGTGNTSDTSDKANLSDASKTNASVMRLSSYWVCSGYCRDPESLQCLLENLTFRENALSTLLPPPCWWPEWSWRVHARANEGEVVIYERTVIHVEHKLSSRWSIVGDTARVSGPHGQIMVAVIFRFTNSFQHASCLAFPVSCIWG